MIPESPVLSDGFFRLRRWSYDDLPCIEEASRDPVIPNGTTVPDPYTESEGRAFVERQWGRFASGEGVSLAVAHAPSDTAAGLVCLLHRQQPGAVGVGYWTIASHRHLGVASSGLVQLSRWALGLPAIHRLEALVETGNKGSIRVLQGAAFHCDGTLRGYFDNGRADALLYSCTPLDLE